MYTNETIDKNACAYTEIYEILRIFPKELVAKIPREQIMFFYNNMDRKYQCNITKENIGKGELLEETVALLTILFRDYWAEPEQRNILMNFTRNAEVEIEKETHEKYNPDNLFKNKEKGIFKEGYEENQQKQSLVEYKETFLKKIVNKILKFLKKIGKDMKKEKF